MSAAMTQLRTNQSEYGRIYHIILSDATLSAPSIYNIAL